VKRELHGFPILPVGTIGKEEEEFHSATKSIFNSITLTPRSPDWFRSSKGGHKNTYIGNVFLSLLTYLLALLEEPPIVQHLKNFPAFYETRMFNTVFTRALHWSLS
jgi:hypothetical protein